VTVEEISDLFIFSLKIAVANRDLPMLEELWSVHTSWESNHLTRLVDILVNEKWNQGLTFVLKSYTTDVIFNSSSYEK
jgi:hypothetical protein